MDAEFAEKAWSVIVFLVTSAAMVAVIFGIFKLIDWARETRRMAEEALEGKSPSRERDDDPRAE